MTVACINVVYYDFYQADVVDRGKRAAAFGLITGLFSAAHVLGNALARFLPVEWIFEACFPWFQFAILSRFFAFVPCFIFWSLHFQVSITLLFCCAIYLKIFLPETLKGSPRPQQLGPSSTMPFRILQERWFSMKDTITLVTSRCVILSEITVSEYILAILSGISKVHLLSS